MSHRIDLKLLHLAEIQHDPAFRDAMAGSTMASAADRQLHSSLARQLYHLGDILGIPGPHDRGRPPVDPAEEHLPGVVVFRVLGRDHSAPDVRTQPSEVRQIQVGCHAPSSCELHPDPVAPEYTKPLRRRHPPVG